MPRRGLDLTRTIQEQYKEIARTKEIQKRIIKTNLGLAEEKKKDSQRAAATEGKCNFTNFLGIIITD